MSPTFSWFIQTDLPFSRESLAEAGKQKDGTDGTHSSHAQRPFLHTEHSVGLPFEFVIPLQLGSSSHVLEIWKLMHVRKRECYTLSTNHSIVDINRYYFVVCFYHRHCWTQFESWQSRFTVLVATLGYDILGQETRWYF